jgi:hypothetical protein
MLESFRKTGVYKEMLMVGITPTLVAEVPQHQAYREEPAVVRYTLSPRFKWTLVSIMGLALLSLGVSLVLVLMSSQFTPEAKSLFETTTTTWKMGFGAIVGLVGGKALSH